MFNNVTEHEKLLFRDTCFGYFMGLEKFLTAHTLLKFIFEHSKVGERKDFFFGDTKVKFS